MHLLTAQAGGIDDGKDPIDLAQTPGDIVVLTSADTEIAGLAKAYSGFQNSSSLRLANLLNLNHNYSIDLYIEQTLKHAKLIIVRVLGGPSYWQYGLDELTRLCRGNNIKLSVMSGSAYKDETLDAYSTIDQETTDQLWSYLVEGGSENYSNFLNHGAHLIEPEKNSKPLPAQPLPKAGIYWPGTIIKSIDDIKTHWHLSQPITAITFYRALLQSGDLDPIDQLIKDLINQGLNPLPIFASSLKDQVAKDIITDIFSEAKPSAIINTTSFAISKPGTDWQGTILDRSETPVFQAILSGSNKDTWQDNPRGLISRDIAMNVTLPEIDGRITTRAISFKSDFGRDENVETSLVGHKAEPNRTEFVAKLAASWSKLQSTEIEKRKVALILSNYPSNDGRIANGVGLDTPAGTIKLLEAMKEAGYDLNTIPTNGDELIKQLQHATADKSEWHHYPLTDFQKAWNKLDQTFKDEVVERWGQPDEDPSFNHENDSFLIRTISLGAVMVGVQPGRGSGLDAKLSHHDATIPPTHEYLAFYFWLREEFKMDAIIHMGKHGNLEWLPGKALALSKSCAPEAILGATPHIYPFIVNDPGEGAQAKRRTSAVIIDHLTPPLTRAESYGPLKDLECLVDEYYEAAGVDPRRTKILGEDIISLAQSIGLSKDCDIKESDCDDTKLQKLDNFLCELKELQIRDGLHIFGEAPKGEQKTNLLLALTRLPRGEIKKEEGEIVSTAETEHQSILRALANDLNLGFDPLITEMATPWQGPKPEVLQSITDQSWRTNGDTVERLEILAEQLVNGSHSPDPSWPKSEWKETSPVLDYIHTHLSPLLETCASKEIEGVLKALDGKFIEPGPSGAPTRGRLDVLPTGRNFYTIDNRTIPTETAWRLGKQSAETVIKAYTQANGEWPKQIALSAWGTSNMRTGGDDIAQALAFIGTRPTWDSASRRVTGFEIIPLSELNRPRVDLLLRISGFFRDAFPAQIDLLQSAINAVADLDENENANPLRAAYLKQKEILQSEGHSKTDADKKAKARIFGSAHMSYGAGLKDMVHSGQWTTREDLADQYIKSSAFTYGQAKENETDGKEALEHFKALLKSTNLVVHNQDTREFDILDSEDFYQFEGGLSASVESLAGKAPEIYHNDHSNPENPKVQTLSEEIAKIVRGRAANPKWIKAIQRHGAKGASEILATVTNLSAFASLTNAVEEHHFESLFEAYLVDEDVREFLQTSNKPAMEEIAKQFQEAIERGLWKPKRNSAYHYLETLYSKAE
ncbi:cobaltochelatase subunit CobN [Hyphomicrobiales bacterium 4NK60-0047b]